MQPFVYFLCLINSETWRRYMENEKQLLEGITKGDAEAIETLVISFSDPLLRVTTAITGDVSLAEEVVQDVFLQVCDKIESFQGNATFKTWVYRIAVNTAKNRLRNRWARKVSCWNEISEKAKGANTDSPEELVLRKENQKELLECLEILPVYYRSVLVLYYLEQLKITEIGQILKKPEGTIKSQLARGRKLLKDIMITKGVEAHG